jgi:Iap family predicted aminopeptidase
VGIGTWIAVDAALVSLDEAVNRDAFVRGIQQVLDETERAAIDEAKAAARALVSASVPSGTG